MAGRDNIDTSIENINRRTSDKLLLNDRRGQFNIGGGG